VPGFRIGSMRSSDRSRALDLERGLPTTAEDVRALRRARTAFVLDLEGYLQFLAQLPPRPGRDTRSKPGPRAADEPFTLRG